MTTKLAVVERCIARIEDVHGERKEDLQPVDVDDITSINLQRAIKAGIDIALHVVSTQGYDTPDSTSDAFTLLERQGVIDPDLADRLRSMVTYRNTAIYNHKSVDPAIVERIVQQRLGDLRALGARIVEAFGLR